MKNITILEENDIQLLKDNIEGMDKIVGTLINQNSSMEYKDYIENLRKLNRAVDAIGCILEIW